jgi:2-methylcitrate dehydratase PrpD
MMTAAPTYRFARSMSGNESGEKVGASSGATVGVAAGASPVWCGKQPRTENVIAITTTINEALVSVRGAILLFLRTVAAPFACEPA